MRLTLRPRWQSMTLPGQFLLAGAVVMLAGMLAVGLWVTSRIEAVVVQNAGIAAALFMESFISPIGQELAASDTLSEPAVRAMDEIFAGTALGERVASYKVWKPDGQIALASDKALVGQRFPVDGQLARALAGQVSASFEDLDDAENRGEARLGVPLLEVYAPIRAVWTGEVIAVAEFYERAETLRDDLARAERQSWLILGAVFLASGLLLFGIVQAGGRTIRAQRAELARQLGESRQMAAANLALRQRVVQASTRATAMTERAVRRIGSDLHDGPAQHLALAALKLDRVFAGDPAPDGPAAELRASLDAALAEIRTISRGLALPDLDRLGLPDLIERAAAEHRRQSGLDVRPPAAPPAPPLAYAQKLCIYRVLQEALSNAARHSGAAVVRLSATLDAGTLRLGIADDGSGFDPAATTLREQGGQGLIGLRDRAESLGGQIDIRSRPGAGTTLTLTLPIEEPIP